MEYKTTPQLTKQVEGRLVTGFAGVFGNVDAGNDRTWKGAFKKTVAEQGGRVKHLWQHHADEPPIAVIRDLREVGRADLPDEIKQRFPEATGALLVSREYLDTPRGSEVLAGIASGAVTEMSFGYDPIKFDFEGDIKKDEPLVRNLREVRLWDTSDVNFGMNAATIASKTAVPYRDTGMADEGAAWSAPTLKDFTDESWDDLSDAEKRRIAAHFAWSANMPPETFGDLKLPHHQAGKSGVGPAVWRGVAAAMGALMGARGGVDIPEGDMMGCHSHLAKHYMQFDKEPPDLKLLDLAWTVRAAQGLDLAALKAGRVLSAANIERLKQALDTLNDILRAAEPEDDGKTAPRPPVDPLTEAQLVARIEQMRRELQRYK